MPHTLECKYENNATPNKRMQNHEMHRPTSRTRSNRQRYRRLRWFLMGHRHRCPCRVRLERLDLYDPLSALRERMRATLDGRRLQGTRQPDAGRIDEMRCRRIKTDRIRPRRKLDRRRRRPRNPDYRMTRPMSNYTQLCELESAAPPDAEGTCRRCNRNRKLTVPESIQSGIGPVCAGRE